jgi:hypothetical protein
MEPPGFVSVDGSAFAVAVAVAFAFAFAAWCGAVT